MRTIVIANSKGGVSKTTTAATVGALLARRGRRVLLIDLDAQQSLTRAFDYPPPRASLADVLDRRGSLFEAVAHIAERLDIVPAGNALGAAERALYDRPGPDTTLARLMQPVAGRYDVAVLDTGPRWDMLTRNALGAAAGVIIPMQPQGHDLGALADFLARVDDMRAINAGLAIIGIVPTFYDARLGHHADVLAALRNMGLHILTPIGRSVKVAEAATARRIITDYAPGNPQALAYETLTSEVLTWLNAQT